MNKKSKSLLLFGIILLLMAAVFGSVSAKPVGNPKGEITHIEEGWLTLKTKDGEITVYLPEEFDYDTIDLEMIVVVKGTWLSETEIEAQWVKPADDDDLEEEEEIEEPEEGEEPEDVFDSPWCNGQKESYHPVVAKIAVWYGESTGVTVEDVHKWFCEGNSVGQIMLALTTQMLDGSDPGETLDQRSSGVGWGVIWQEKGLIGNAREGEPPGQAKKPDKAVPPGLLKKTTEP
jgi:hypothetical protein